MTIPALRQSGYETMSCGRSYQFQVIEGHKAPPGMPSVRGTEVHHVWAVYSKHCAVRKVSMDLAKFDELALGVLGEAAPILNGIRDTYQVDWENFYDAEILLRWTEQCSHCDGSGRVPSPAPWKDEAEIISCSDCDGTGNGILEAEGTLDGLYFLTPSKAKIEDAKTHPRPFDADTFQSKLYPFLVLMNFPQVEEVTFELIFVRYTNCRRSVTYTREDIPMLRQQVINARMRQVRYHERHAAGETLEALPGAHCQYCPLIKGFDCPIAEFNEHANHSLEERARFVVWAQNALTVNKQVLKDAVDARGNEPVQIKDGNGRVIQFKYNDRESNQFPLLQTMPFLFEHRDTYPDDVEWIGKLLISSTKLKSYLGAKKRTITHQAIMDNAAKPITKTKFEAVLPNETVENEPALLDWEE